MLGVGGFVAIGDDRLSPRTISIRTLMSRGVGTRIRIVGLGHTLAPVWAVGGSAAGVGSRVGIVNRACPGSSVRAGVSFSGSGTPGVWILVLTYAVSRGRRMIGGVST